MRFKQASLSTWLADQDDKMKIYFQKIGIPLIGKDGDDVIDNITCELTGTESINTQTEYTYLCGKMCLTLLVYVEFKAELTKINLT